MEKTAWIDRDDKIRLFWIMKENVTFEIGVYE
jgi:hypothetical protein